MIGKLVVENLKHRRVRTFISILLIGLEVTMILTLVGLSRGSLNEAKRRARGVGADIFVKPPGTSVLSFGTASIPEGMIQWLERLPHVVAADGTVVHAQSALTSVSGIDLERFRKMSGGFKYVSGGPFRQPGDIIIDEYYAQQNHLKVDDTIKLFDHQWRVCGIVVPGQQSHLVLPIHELQHLTGTTGKVSQLYVKVDNQANLNAVMDEIKKAQPEYGVYSLAEFLSMFSADNVPMLRPFTNIVIGVATIIGFLITLLTMYTAVLERTREIGILKALGASPMYVLNILLRETAVLAVFGIILGILLSFLSRVLIQTYAPAVLTQEIVPDWWLIAGALALTGALLGALYPGLKAAKQDPIEALAYD